VRFVLRPHVQRTSFLSMPAKRRSLF